MATVMEPEVKHERSSRAQAPVEPAAPAPAPGRQR